jgi:aspartyl-tRNA synthetase
VRARVHNVRGKGNNCFIILRENFSTLQTCAFTSEATPKEMITYMSNIPNESIVDITGKVAKPNKPIQSCTQQVELQILKCFIVSRSANRLPLQISDASRQVLSN